ncbi:MAG: DUF302 domain-containing protein [Gemmatimonadetes bacterium]|nr:DUF302 domain-containing protein [Gemmatimonadota bacterium]
MKPFALPLTVDLPIEAAVERLTEALRGEGFGVLTTIDLAATFKNKLGVAFRPYLILGVCNPMLAHQAVSAVPETGLLLPCTVTVEALGTQATQIRIANPEAVLTTAGFGDVPEVLGVAREAKARLSRVLDHLAALEAA